MMWRLALILCVACGLTGCESFRMATGSGKMAPDEFQVMPKAPLVMPPDYNLRPPEAGSHAANMSDPATMARATLYPKNPQAVEASLGPAYSDGEKIILAYSGAANASPSIRAQLAADSGQDEQGQGFADTVLFWQSPAADNATPVDAQAEAERLRKARAAGQPVAPPPSPGNAPTGNSYPDYPAPRPSSN
jgi:Protein of unknown function (DUF3035)